MRTTSQNFGVIKNDAGEILGVSLGADYCAEHERGFNSWGSELGIAKSATREVNGLEARRVTTNDATILYGRVGKELVLAVIKKYQEKYWPLEELVKQFHSHPRHKPYDQMTKEQRALSWDKQPLADIRTAWSDGMGFMIIAQTKTGEEAVEVVYEALTGLHLAIGYGSNANPFSRAGLNLIDINKIPDSINSAMSLADLDHINLHEFADKTGIKTRLANANLRYYALSPSWADNKSQVKFWLNPYNQDQNNFGWYTVQELDQWIAGTGPIPKKVK